MKYPIGEKLRTIREKKKLTLKQVSQKAGVSDSLLSQVERNKVSPALDTLLSISDALDIDFDSLFWDYRKTKGLHITHQTNRDRFESDGIIFELLSSMNPSDPDHAIEAYLMKVPSHFNRDSVKSGHFGHEIGIILSGTGKIEFGDQFYPITTGDTLSFRSDIPHRLFNTGENDLTAIWIVTPPKLFPVQNR